MTIEVIIIFFLIFANAFFAMSEMAIVSARKLRLQQRAEKGDSGARKALDLANSPNSFLSTVQIGITLIGILAGAFGGATIAKSIAAYLNRFHFMQPYSEVLGVGLVVLSITYLSLVLGELVPKRLALSHSETIAASIAPWMGVIAKITLPFARLLSLSTDLVLKLFRIRTPTEMPVTEEEIKLMIKQGTQVGVLERTEQELIERIFRLNDRPVNAIMTPRPEVIWLEADESYQDICTTITDKGYSYFPVAHGSLEDIIGVVKARDLLAQSLDGATIDMHSVLRPAVFVPESMSALEVLDHFKKQRAHVALVVDEYGGFQGLVTLDDIMAAIVGEIPLPGENVEPEIVQREDGSWFIDGRLIIDQVKELLAIDHLPDEGAGYYHTLGGFVMTYLGRIPTSGDYFDWAGYRFEVVDMDGRRVDKVWVSRIPKSVDNVPDPFATID